MAEILDSCEKGLTPKCFADYPEWAKMALAYRLLLLICGPHLPKELQKYLLKILFDPDSEIPDSQTPGDGDLAPEGYEDSEEEDFATVPIIVTPGDGGPITLPGKTSPVGTKIEVTILSTGSDGYCVSRADNWPDAITGGDYRNAVSGGISEGDAISVYLEAALYYVKRAFFYFDLSPIPSGSKIKKAVLGITGIDQAESSVRVYQGNQQDPLVHTDFNEYGGYPFAEVDWQCYVAPDLNTNLITLSSGGRSYIQDTLGGIAKFCLREHTKDCHNVRPDDLHPLNGCAFSEHPVEGYPPFLTVVYV